MSAQFTQEMLVSEALALHPRAREVFAGLHLGCSHCAIADFEDIKTVCAGYGVPMDALLETLNSLLDSKEDP